jgi:hypothetical protein
MSYIAPPVISGWSNGKPDFNSNPATAVDERKGRLGLPGLYDNLSQQWGTVRAHMAKGRAALEVTSIELQVPETPDPLEAAWNRRAFEWLQSNCGLQEAVGTRYGVAPLLAWAHDVVWHGWGVLVPRWLDEDNPGWTGKAQMQPLVRSAVSRFRTELNSLTLTGVEYQGQGSYLVIDYDQCIHLAWGGQPGEAFGQGELRPLIGPYIVWAGTVTYVGQLQTSQAGRLIMYEPPDASSADRERLQEVGEDFDAGQLRYAIMPFESRAEFAAASGAIPDPTAACAWADAQADRLFASRNSSLVQSAHGSRAVAETLGAEDAEWALDRWDQIIADVIGGVLQWLARETGYAGRIYKAQAVRPEQDSEDTTALVTTLAQAVGAGLIAWAPEDETELRARLGWSIRTAAPLTEHKHTALCNHEPLELSEPPYSSVGRDGLTIRHRLPEIAVELQGHVVYPERHVAWMSDDAAETDLRRDLDAAMAPLIDQHRAAVGALSPNDAAGLRALRDEYEGLYYQQLRASATAWRDLGREQAREEAADQVATPVSASARDSTATVSMVETVRRLRADQALQTAAREIASRVEGEALQRPGMVTRQTVAGLLASSVGALRTVEESARVLEALRPDDTGLVVVALVRTSRLDGSVCGHCKDQHGRRFLFPEDEEEFTAYIAQFGPPDPSCEGGATRCRCRFVPVYGRVS